MICRHTCSTHPQNCSLAGSLTDGRQVFSVLCSGWLPGRYPAAPNRAQRGHVATSDSTGLLYTWRVLIELVNEYINPCWQLGLWPLYYSRCPTICRTPVPRGLPVVATVVAGGHAGWYKMVQDGKSPCPLMDWEGSYHIPKERCDVGNLCSTCGSKSHRKHQFKRLTRFCGKGLFTSWQYLKSYLSAERGIPILCERLEFETWPSQTNDWG